VGCARDSQPFGIVRELDGLVLETWWRGDLYELLLDEDLASETALTWMKSLPGPHLSSARNFVTPSEDAAGTVV
jgi:hypothetical protein